MARVNDLFSVGFNGRIGNLIGYEWRGRMCVRSMPAHYNDAQSERQLAQRALFKATIGFAARARSVVQTGLRKASIDARMLETNYFMRINKRCFSIADGSLVVDYESLILADGPVAPVAFSEPALLDDTTIQVDFEKNPLQRVAKQEDVVYLVAYCPEVNTFYMSAGNYRYKCVANLQLPDLWAGKEVHLWGFIVDKAGRASMSQYLGQLVLNLEAFDAAMDERTEEEIDLQEDAAHYQTETDKTPFGTDAGTKATQWHSPPLRGTPL